MGVQVMRVVTKCDGVIQEHDIPQGVKCLVHENGIKVEAPDAFTITPTSTVECMREMSQEAWEHISTGPLFQHFFNELFRDRPVKLPATIKALNEDYDDGVIHACGLIILLVESRFESKTKVFLKLPETHLHPAVVCHLMTVILGIEKIPLGNGKPGDIEVTQ